LSFSLGGGEVRLSGGDLRGDKEGETGNSDEFEFAMLTIVAVSSVTEKVVVGVVELLGLIGKLYRRKY
jgi:hypothetical protein